MNNDQLITILGHNHYVINKNLEGITNKDSFKKSPAGENNINWLLGHIVASRDTFREQLGLKPLMDDNIYSIYERTTDNFSEDNAIEITKLLEMYNLSQKELYSALGKYEIKDENDLNQTCAMVFHETYHAGQLGILRRLIGKEGNLK